MAVPFHHGFNDLFHGYAGSEHKTIAFQRAREPWGETIRFGVSWEWVGQWGPTSFHWKPQPGDLVPYGWDYEALRAEANARNLRMLPVVIGCPTGWVLRADREPCKPELEAHKAPWDLQWYPSTDWARDHFADFCVETLKYFDNCGRTDAIEVWNEPNLHDGARIADPARFRALLAKVIEKVAAANAANLFKSPKTVVSGGLFMDYQAANWKAYLDAFKDQPGLGAIAIHPYDTRKHEQLSSTSAADEVVKRVSELYEQAASRTSAFQELWVTETGASSRAPFGYEGQKRALRKLVGRTSNGGWFATRARCRAALLHRLYPYGQMIPGHEDSADRRFEGFSLVEYGTWTPKPAWWMLVEEWQ